MIQASLAGRPARPLTRFLPALVCAVLASACATLDMPRGLSQAPSEPRAEALAVDGEYAASARMYARLAEGATGTEADRLSVLSAAQWLAAGDVPAATRRFEGIAQPASTTEAGTDWLLVRAGLDNAAGETERALRHLDAIRAPQPNLRQRMSYAAIRADALYANGEPADATSQLTRRELWLQSEREILDNHQRIWDGLRSVDQAVLIQAISDTRDPLVRGWMELVAVTNPVRDNEAMLGRAVAGWVRANPGHPANSSFVPILVESAGEPGDGIRQIALMLPLGGRERTAAAAIRDGFVAAHLSDAPAFNAPEVIVYDTSTDGALVTYEAAINEGADVVVGPLTKTEVREMALAAQLPAPLLALNQLGDEDFVPAGFYQFALSPEDEAREVARRTVASGLNRAIALVPEGAWGQGILDALSAELALAGGLLLDYETYNPSETDYSNAIERVTQIRASVGRRDRLRQVLGEPLQYEPRRRADIDFIFIAATPSSARALKPQLRFHYSGDLPVYATTNVYAEDGRNNNDLDGIRFPEIPWLIAPGEAPAPSAAEFARHWRSNPQFARLHAFGLDAYRVALELFNGRLEGPLAGASGLLTLRPDGRIARQLKWAAFDGDTITRLPDLERPEPLYEVGNEWPEATSSN